MFEWAIPMGVMLGMREQPVVFLFDYLVTFTDLFFQPLPVQYGDVATVIIDESRLLQFPGDFLRNLFRGARPTYWQSFHGRWPVVRREPFQALQEPAAELLRKRMMPVADRRLSHWVINA